MQFKNKTKRKKGTTKRKQRKKKGTNQTTRKQNVINGIQNWIQDQI